MPRPLPLFHVSSSLREGGIFTVDKAGAAAKAKRFKGPVSLCDLARDEKLAQLHLVASNFVDFMMAHKHLREVGCDLVFGLKLVICESMADKSEESLKSESKVVVFMREGGYQRLIQLYTKASTDGFYYVPRLDWAALAALWSDDLTLALPFYSSFLAKNTLTFAAITPRLPAPPIVLREVGQQLPFDHLLDQAVDRYVAANPCEVQPCKSIYYRRRQDARNFLIWRSILERKTWDIPPDGMTSREFAYEAWKELP